MSMSTLYFGTGKLEKYLVEKLANKMETHKNMKLNILLDFMRGNRYNSKTNSSSLSLIWPLKENHLGKKVRIGMFHMPSIGLL